MSGTDESGAAMAGSESTIAPAAAKAGRRWGLPTQALTEQPYSAFQNLLGFTIVEWSEGHASVELPVTPEILNRTDIVHGGVLAGLIDVVCGLAGSFCPVPGNIRTGSTLALSTSFVAPVRRGPIRAVGRVKGGGRRIFQAEA